MAGKGSMRGTRAATGLASLACALALPAAFGLSTPAVAAKGNLPLILSPRAGDGVPAKPVLVRVHTGRKSHRFRAQLNGHPIAKYFSRPSHHGVRKLEVSLSYGLHHGRNRLHVRVGHHRTDGANFRVWKGRPLVGAGVDRTVAAGAKVVLNARFRQPPSQNPRTSARQPVRGANPQLEWSTTDAPPGSPLTAPHGSGRRATFKPAVPGSYTLQASSPSGSGKTVSDSTDVIVDPPPAVPVETMAPSQGDALSGIKVGDTFYAPDPLPGGKLPWAQGVALNRSNLKPISDEAENFTIGCDDERGLCPEAQDELEGDLGSVGSKAIVIVANPTPAAGNCIEVARPFGLETALSSIGVSATGFDQQAGATSCGTISAIGAPGTTPGEGDWHTVTSLGGGDMQGYLVRNNEGNYTFEGYDRVAFDTQAQGSTGSQNVIQIGTKSYPQNVASGGGFEVLVLDSQTLQGSADWFETDQGDKQALIGELNRMQGVLHRANTADGLHQKLVFVASLGNPVIQYYQRQNRTSPDDQVNGAIKSLVDEVESLGGTRNAFYRTLDPKLSGDSGYSYTLVAPGGSGPGMGDEDLEARASGTSASSLSAARITGTLARTGRNYSFRVDTSPASTLEHAPAGPATGDPTEGVAELLKVAFQRPTLWPEQDPAVFPDAKERERKQAAINWIGKKVFGNTNVRGMYWTEIYSAKTWDDYATAIQKLRYSDAAADGVDFSSDDLSWAQTELAGTPPGTGGEIHWLENAHSALSAIALPFDKDILANWSQAQTIASNINDDVKVSSDVKVHAINKAMFDFDRSIAVEAVPEAAQPFAYAANDIYEVAMQLADVSGQPADEPFDGKFNEVGERLADRLVAEQKFLEQKLPNVIAADYGKLSVVGACASKLAPDRKACPFDAADWQLTQDKVNDVATAFKRATRLWAYGALLPARYTLWQLPVWWQQSLTTFPFRQFYGVTTDDFWVPFDPSNFPSTAQVAKPVYRNIPSYTHQLGDYNGDTRTVTPTSDQWQLSALGRLEGEGTVFKPWVMKYPGASVTDELFGEPNKQNPNNLGADPETFFDRSFTPKTLSHYPEQDTPTGWCAVNRSYGGSLPLCDP